MNKPLVNSLICIIQGAAFSNGTAVKNFMEIYKSGTGEKKIHSLNSVLPKFKAVLFINTMKVQTSSSSLHSVSKSDFEMKDCMRLQAISGGNIH